MHGNRILSPDPKFISSIIKQSEYFDEEILVKVNNKYYNPTEFNNALNELSTKKQNLYMHLNISSLSYHHLELIRLKYKLRKNLNIYQKGMIESTFVEIIDKIEKNMVAGCIYKHPKQTIPDFLDNHLLPLLEKLSYENKQILIMGDLHINLLNYDDKNAANFLDTMFSYSYLPFINTPTRVTGHSKTLIDNIFYNKPMLNLTAGNISSVISGHLIQFLIEPSSTNAKLEQTCKLQRCYKNMIRQNLKMTYTKSAGKNIVVIQIQMWP